MIWLVAAALVIGFLLISAGKSTSQRRGLTDAATVDLDTRVLYSARYGLTGRPDRLFREGQFVIPEEWKSSHQIYDNHRAQLGCYFILVEEEYGVRPPYGVIVTGNGGREKVANTDQLRAWVLELAEQIRAARRELDREIPVRQPAANCRGCGMRERCGQRTNPSSGQP